MNWKTFLDTEIRSAYDIAEGLLEMTDDTMLDWKPSTGSNWMTTAQLLHHLTDACGAPMKGFVTGDWGLPEGMDFADLSPEDMLPSAEKMPAVASVADARERLTSDRALALEMLGQCGADRLANETTSAPWNPGQESSLGRHLFEMTRHLDKHACQLFMYLKLQGKPVNTSHLWR